MLIRGQHSPGRAEESRDGRVKWEMVGGRSHSCELAKACELPEAPCPNSPSYSTACPAPEPKSGTLAAADQPCVFAAGYYFTGDGAYRSQKGYYQITGRMDDVINISGHRLGTAEIEDAMVSSKQVEVP